MILISYDISDDRVRSRFAKYIMRFGHRIQASVYEIDNSTRILENIMLDIEQRFSKEFSENDSVLIFRIKNKDEVIRYGFNAHDDANILIV